jgi:hypothetical protein
MARDNNLYYGHRHKLRLSMYVVIRCPGCNTFTYVDRYQQWKLCPVCGEVIEVVRAPAYLEVASHIDAERLAKELQEFLQVTGKEDFTRGEKEKLRAEYARLVRSSM